MVILYIVVLPLRRKRNENARIANVPMRSYDEPTGMRAAIYWTRVLNFISNALFFKLSLHAFCASLFRSSPPNTEYMWMALVTG